MHVSRHMACRRDSGTPGTLVSHCAAAATASKGEQHTMLAGPSDDAWATGRLRGAE